MKRRLESAYDLAGLILQKEEMSLFVNSRRFDVNDETIPLQSFWIDGEDKRTPTGRSWILKWESDI